MSRVPIVTVILNEKAGAGDSGAVRTAIAKVAAEHGAAVRILVPEDGDDLGALAKEAGADGGTVVAAGGDGTVAAIAAGLVGSEVPFGVLPTGTLNHFAKDLGLPLELEAAAETLFSGRVARVDVGEVNGRIFVNNSSVGFYPQIVRERERQQRRGRTKWVALASATAGVFRRSRSMDVELEVDGARRAFRAPLVFVGNNRYEVSGLEIGSRKRLDSGLIWVCTAPSTGRFGLVRLAILAFLGLSGAGEELASVETDQVTVRMRRRQVDVATDGEVALMSTPLRYRSLPAALRVLVPEPTERK